MKNKIKLILLVSLSVLFVGCGNNYYHTGVPATYGNHGCFDNHYISNTNVVQPSTTIVRPRTTLVQPTTTVVRPTTTLVQPYSNRYLRTDYYGNRIYSY